MTPYELISQFEDDCRADAEVVIERVCRRVLGRVREELDCIVPDDFADAGFNAADYIAYEWGCHGLSLGEIYPGLNNCIYGWIEDEIEAVPGAEGTVLRYSHIGQFNEPDLDAVVDEIRGRLLAMLEERAERGKVCRYWEMNG